MVEEYNKWSTDDYTEVKPKNNLIGGKAQSETTNDLKNELIRELKEELKD